MQLQLLLQYLKDDPRKAVKRLAINDLKLLAKKAPHLWIRENTQVVFQMLKVALLDCSMLAYNQFANVFCYFFNLCRPCVSVPWPALTSRWSWECWLSSPPSLEQLQSSNTLIISQVLFMFYPFSITMRMYLCCNWTLIAGFPLLLNFEKGTTRADLRSSQTFLAGGPSVPPRLTDLVKLAQECCYHSNLAVAAHGVIVLSNIAISFPEKG